MRANIPSVTEIVIGIPTFRRAEPLRRLLESLNAQLLGRGATVIVADNDCNESIRSMITARLWTFQLRYLAVPEPGLAAVRNALVDDAIRTVPDWRWLIMIDDDCVASPGWVSALVLCACRFDADLVGGPVLGGLPATAGLLARNSLLAGRRRWPTGPVGQLNSTQNLLIARQTLLRVSMPLFCDAYGVSGGEDYDLFRRMQKAGGRLVWCDEAVVAETTSADRLTAPAVLSRYFTTGIYMAKIDRAHDGSRLAWVAAVRGLSGALLKLLSSLLALDRNRGAREILGLSHYVGRWAGLLGGRSRRYGRRTS